MEPTRQPTLDTVRVVGGRRVSGRLDEFETRRVRGQTTKSITREEIEKRNPIDISQLLQSVPSVKVSSNAGVTSIYSTRSSVPGPDGKSLVACRMAIMVDGVVLPVNADIDDRVRPDAVYGVEVFSGPAMIPPQFNSLGGGIGGEKTCGLIAIWTR
jgi:outer membrane receptor for Fe3+-dicitrate